MSTIGVVHTCLCGYTFFSSFVNAILYFHFIQDEVDYIISGVWSKFLDQNSGLQPQNHRYRLRNFPKSYTAHAIVEWLVNNAYVESR